MACEERQREWKDAVGTGRMEETSREISREQPQQLQPPQSRGDDVRMVQRPCPASSSARQRNNALPMSAPLGSCCRNPFSGTLAGMVFGCDASAIAQQGEPDEILLSSVHDNGYDDGGVNNAGQPLSSHKENECSSSSASSCPSSSSAQTAMSAGTSRPSESAGVLHFEKKQVTMAPLHYLPRGEEQQFLPGRTDALQYRHATGSRPVSFLPPAYVCPVGGSSHMPRPPSFVPYNTNNIGFHPAAAAHILPPSGVPVQAQDLMYLKGMVPTQPRHCTMHGFVAPPVGKQHLCQTPCSVPRPPQRASLFPHQIGQFYPVATVGAPNSELNAPPPPNNRTGHDSPHSTEDAHGEDQHETSSQMRLPYYKALRELEERRKAAAAIVKTQNKSNSNTRAVVPGNGSNCHVQTDFSRLHQPPTASVKQCQFILSKERARTKDGESSTKNSPRATNKPAALPEGSASSSTSSSASLPTSSSLQRCALTDGHSGPHPALPRRRGAEEDEREETTPRVLVTPPQEIKKQHAHRIAFSTPTQQVAVCSEEETASKAIQEKFLRNFNAQTKSKISVTSSNAHPVSSNTEEAAATVIIAANVRNNRSDNTPKSPSTLKGRDPCLPRVAYLGQRQASPKMKGVGEKSSTRESSSREPFGEEASPPAAPRLGLTRTRSQRRPEGTGTVPALSPPQQSSCVSSKSSTNKYTNLQGRNCPAPLLPLLSSSVSSPSPASPVQCKGQRDLQQQASSQKLLFVTANLAKSSSSPDIRLKKTNPTCTSKLRVAAKTTIGHSSSSGSNSRVRGDDGPVAVPTTAETRGRVATPSTETSSDVSRSQTQEDSPVSAPASFPSTRSHQPPAVGHTTARQNQKGCGTDEGRLKTLSREAQATPKALEKTSRNVRECGGRQQSSAKIPRYTIKDGPSVPIKVERPPRALHPESTMKAVHCLVPRNGEKLRDVVLAQQHRRSPPTVPSSQLALVGRSSSLVLSMGGTGSATSSVLLKSASYGVEGTVQLTLMQGDQLNKKIYSFTKNLPKSAVLQHLQRTDSQIGDDAEDPWTRNGPNSLSCVVKDQTKGNQSATLTSHHHSSTTASSLSAIEDRSCSSFSSENNPIATTALSVLSSLGDLQKTVESDPANPTTSAAGRANQAGLFGRLLFGGDDILKALRQGEGALAAQINEGLVKDNNTTYHGSSNNDGGSGGLTVCEVNFHHSTDGASVLRACYSNPCFRSMLDFHQS